MFRYNDTIHRHFGDEPFGGRGPVAPREDMPHGRGGGRFRTLPEQIGGGDGQDMPRDFGPRMPGGPGFPRGGMPPHAPSPDFLKQRIEESDLDELLALAGRMARHRPEAVFAQGQNLILSILAGRDVLSQRALQLMLGIQPGSLSEILTKLERKGFITREKAEDRRGNLLRITDAGRRAIPDAETPAQDDRFSALTEAQQDQLAGLLRALLNDWVVRFGQPPRGPENHNPRGGRFVPLKGEPTKV